LKEKVSKNTRDIKDLFSIGNNGEPRERKSVPVTHGNSADNEAIMEMLDDLQN
jgi:hypothetical protein